MSPREPSSGVNSAPAPSPDDFVTALLTASRVLVGVSARSLTVVEDTVTLSQFRALVVLVGYGEVNLNRLAELLAVNSSTAMRMIDRLLISDLVTRRENPGNRREVLLAVSFHGSAVVRKVTEARRQDIARIVQAMPAGQRTDLIAALRGFADAAHEPPVSFDPGVAPLW
ncbi:DNA-binding MarR family transcriptional regulator [Nakamurella sp. UYEF19]|uniref:MarR family winged helix-turn-helix transcriptional regulator n=1 Tax=Nakamurella sp. UYEF19 TaxID=1756392 RepID=UPI003390DBB6